MQDKPWVTDEFRDFISQRQHAHKHDKTLYKQLRNRVNNPRHILQSNYYKHQVEGAKSENQSKWWEGVQHLMGKSTTSNPMTTMANHLHGGDMEALADNINSFFQSITAHMDPLEEMDFGALEIPSKYQVTVKQVKKSLLAINTSKSPGPDYIPSWVLRDFAGILGGPICAILDNTIRQGYLPTIWKIANVAPLPKCSPALRVENDIRSVSLTAILCKEICSPGYGRYSVRTSRKTSTEI